MTRIAIVAQRGAIYHVDAAVFGDWAAHSCHCCTTTWAVTHVPTGRRVHSEVQLDDVTALAIAHALSVELPAGSLPVILPSDQTATMPHDLVQRINRAFYGALESSRRSSPAVASTVDRGHGVARGER